MSEIEFGAGRLVPGNVGHEANEIAYPRPHALVTKWFIAANIVIADGRLAPIVVTPYLHTYAAAEKELSKVREDYPFADILWVHTVYDTEDDGHLIELAKVLEQTEIEQRAEGYQ